MPMPAQHLSLAILGLDPTRSASARDLIALGARAGYRGVQIDATYPGLRPRELDRSARRDLAALCARSGLVISGVDCFVPARHLLAGEHQDRAMHALIASLELSADLARLGDSEASVVSCELPADLPSEITDAFEAACDRFDTRLADHATTQPTHALHRGVDPAACLEAGTDPATHAASLGERLGSARLSDRDEAARVLPVVEVGRLDLPAYRVALVSAGYERPLVVDLRGVPDAILRCSQVPDAWDGLPSIPLL